MNGPAFEHILASLHEASLDDAHWPTASALIDEALGVHGNCMGLFDWHSQAEVQLFFVGFFFRGQRRLDLEREYYEDYFPLDERYARAQQFPASQPVHITHLYTEEELKNSVVYNDLATRMHAQDSINLRLDGPDGSTICWGINDPVDGNGWPSARLESIQRLLPHIRQYVRMRHALAAARALGASLTELLDTANAGIIQLDWRGRILEVNDRARNLLRTGDGLFDERGFLSARSPEDNTHLRALLKQALPLFKSQGVAGSVMVRRESGLPPLVLHINPVSRHETDLRIGPLAALVLVVDPMDRPRIDPARVEAALGLTGTESRVAALLAEGMSVRDIAAAMGRKESTIRSHVKHMFAKYHLSRQADLVRLVLSLTHFPPSRA